MKNITVIVFSIIASANAVADGLDLKVGDFVSISEHGYPNSDGTYGWMAQVKRTVDAVNNDIADVTATVSVPANPDRVWTEEYSSVTNQYALIAAECLRKGGPFTPYTAGGKTFKTACSYQKPVEGIMVLYVVSTEVPFGILRREELWASRIVDEMVSFQKN